MKIQKKIVVELLLLLLLLTHGGELPFLEVDVCIGIRGFTDESCAGPSARTPPLHFIIRHPFYLYIGIVTNIGSIVDNMAIYQRLVL